MIGGRRSVGTKSGALAPIGDDTSRVVHHYRGRINDYRHRLLDDESHYRGVGRHLPILSLELRPGGRPQEGGRTSLLNTLVLVPILSHEEVTIVLDEVVSVNLKATPTAFVLSIDVTVQEVLDREVLNFREVPVVFDGES